MSEGLSKAYFENQVAELSAAMRLEALKVANYDLQLADLESRKNGSLGAYRSLQAKLQETIELAREVLGLEDGWVCAVDVGQLIPPSPAPSPKDEPPPKPRKGRKKAPAAR